MSIDDDFEEVEEETEEELPEAPPAKRNNLEKVNEKRKVNKKANQARFLISFADNNKKTLEEICSLMGIARETGRKYLNEYVSVVMDSIKKGRYPTSALQYYNIDMPEGQRLTAGHMNDLRPIVIKYNGSNIESLMLEMGHITEEEVITEEEEEVSPEEEILEDYVENGGQFKEFNEVKQKNRNVIASKLHPGSPIQDIIRFGIINCGQPDDAKIRKITNIFMDQPQYYLSDESAFEEILKANGIKAETLSAFMRWLKNVAPLSPQQRQGFLALNNNFVANNNVQPPQVQKKNFNNFDINDYDEFAQYLYHEGVYKYGLPPDHPVNVESYKEHLEEKKQRKLEEQSNRQFNMALKQRVLEMQSGRFMGQPQQGVPQQTSVLDANALMAQGIVAPEITYDAYGRQQIRYIPTGKTPADVYGGGTQNKDQFLESVNTVTRLIEALKPALNMGGQGGPANDLMNKFMTAAIEKLVNKAEESPTQLLDTQLGLFTKLQQAFPQNGGGDRARTDSELQTEIRLKEIENDKFFASEELKLKQKDYELRQTMMQKQEEESKNGIEMILSWLGKGFEMVSPILNSVLMGNMGGGIGNILGGMMPGGGGGLGGMMPGGPMAQPNIPPQPPNEFEVVEPTSGFVPPPQTVPQDFLPSQPVPEYTPQPTYEQPAPVYEPQQYNTPQYGAPPQPEYNTQYNQQYEQPDDFLDNVTVNDLDSLTVGQLDEITNRIETKASKIEKLLNSIKKAKVSKQFGYNRPLKKTVKKTIVQPQEDYSVLNMPPTINPDYDGVSNSPNLVDEEGPEQFIEVNDSQPTFLNYDIDMYSMGNDNQQFNQQNDANQPEYIEKITAQQKAENLRLENERRKAKGLAPLPDGTVVDESGKEVSEDSLKASDNKYENSDKYNDNPGLDATKSHSSDEFNKDHKGKGKDKQHDNEDAVKEKEKKGTADHKYDNTTKK